MVENVYKNNKCTPATMSSATADESVILLRPQNNLFVWVVAMLLGGLVASFFLFVFLTFWDRDGISRSSAASLPSVDSTALLRDVEFLKGRMNLLITGAMESKIEQLEHSLKGGIISRTDLATVQELKEDLKALKVYSLQNASTTFGLLEKAGNTAPTYSGASLYSDELMHEISTMKNLFYISIASWGVAIAILGGTWLRGQYRLRQISNEHLFRHRMLEKPKTGIY